MAGKFKKGELRGAAKTNKAAAEGDPVAIQKKQATVKKIAKSITENTEKKRAEIALYDTIRTTLIDSGDYSKFLTTFINKAKADPNSRSGMKLADILLNDETIKSLDNSYDKIIARDHEFQEYRILKRFFKEQQSVLLDELSNFIFLPGGRRSGKTQVVSGLFVKKALKPGSHMAYVHRRFESSIRQMFDLVIKLSEEVELKIKTSSKSAGFIEWENGSQMIFVGNNDITSLDRFRGEKMQLIVFDEVAFQKNLKIGINEVIEPLRLDSPDLRLVLSSTPPRAPHHYSEKLYNDKRYKKYHWNFYDNPTIKNTEDFIQTICEEKGVTMDSPYIRREYLGEWGVYDTESQVFKTRHYWDPTTPLPFTPNEIIGGVDYGEQAYNAIILIAYNTFQKKGVVIHEDKFNRSNLTEFENRLKIAEDKGRAIIKQYDLAEDRFAFYVDTNEPIISNELSSKGHRVYPAYKYDKQFAIEQLADLLRKGLITIIKDGPFDEECDQILWPRDDQTDAIIYNKGFDEDQGIHPDIAMALLYASRQFCFDCGIEGGAQVKEKEYRYGEQLPGTNQ